jgi:hypothetical protein
MMHDRGGGKRSMSPFYSDFARFTATTSTSFGGITGGSSSSPGRGDIDYVALDATGRVYLFHDLDLRLLSLSGQLAQQREKEHPETCPCHSLELA